MAGAWKTMLRIPCKMTLQDLTVGWTGKSRTVTNLSSFSHFSGFGPSSAPLWLSFSFTPLGTLVFPLHSPHVLLHATVHHLEVSLDAGGASYLLTWGALFGHNIGHLPLLLPNASLLIDTKYVQRKWQGGMISITLQQRVERHFPVCNCTAGTSYLFNWDIFSFSEMSTVLTTASAFFFAWSIFFSIWKNRKVKKMRSTCLTVARNHYFWKLERKKKSLQEISLFLHSYPPLLPGLCLSNSFDWPGINLLPFLFVLLHHLPGDRHGLQPVFLFVLQEPLGYIPRLIRTSKSAANMKDLYINTQFLIIIIIHFITLVV